MTNNDLDDIFAYYSPTSEQQLKYKRLREAARTFAQVVLECTLKSPDQTVAIRKIREAVMAANASIALEGKY